MARHPFLNMNAEQAEHRIFEIIRRVCAKHDIDIVLHPEQSEDDDGRLHVTVDYLRSRRSKVRRLMANMAVGISIGNAAPNWWFNRSDFWGHRIGVAVSCDVRHLVRNH